MNKVQGADKVVPAVAEKWFRNDAGYAADIYNTAKNNRSLAAYSTLASTSPTYQYALTNAPQISGTFDNVAVGGVFKQNGLLFMMASPPVELKTTKVEVSGLIRRMVTHKTGYRFTATDPAGRTITFNADMQGNITYA